MKFYLAFEILNLVWYFVAEKTFKFIYNAAFLVFLNIYHYMFKNNYGTISTILGMLLVSWDRIGNLRIKKAAIHYPLASVSTEGPKIVSKQTKT